MTDFTFFTLDKQRKGYTYMDNAVKKKQIYLKKSSLIPSDVDVTISTL